MARLFIVLSNEQVQEIDWELPNGALAKDYKVSVPTMIRLRKLHNKRPLSRGRPWPEKRKQYA